jgi:hypothetical protein
VKLLCVDKLLVGCNKSRKLDFDTHLTIKNDIKYVRFKPISIIKLKEENVDIFNIIN